MRVGILKKGSAVDFDFLVARAMDGNRKNGNLDQGFIFLNMNK